MNLVSSMITVQYMHFIVMRTFFVKRAKATVEISAYAYLFNAEENLPGGQYTASSVSLESKISREDAAKACAKLFRACRDNAESPVNTLKIVDHTEGQLIAKFVAEADYEDLKAKEGQNEPT